MRPDQITGLDWRLRISRAITLRVALITCACATLGLAYALLTPQWYRATLTVVPASDQTPGFASLLGGELGGLAAGLGSSLGGSADSARITAVLHSVSVTDAVIQKFDLKSRYGEKYQESTREELWRHCDVKALTKPNLVDVSCEDKDPQFAQQMLAFFAEYGNQVFRRVGVTSTSEEVRFLDKHVSELRQRADDAAARMRDFEEQHKIIDIDTQAKAVVSALAALNGEKIRKQIELGYARRFAAPDEATTQQLESQLSVMGTTLRDLEGGGTSSRASGRGADTHGVFPAALAVPKLRADFEKLFRDRKVAETTLVFALERLEVAKAKEAGEVSTFLVLDPPVVPTRKSRPRRSLIVIVSVLVGLAVGVGLEWWKSGGAKVLGFVDAEQAGAEPVFPRKATSTE